MDTATEAYETVYPDNLSASWVEAFKKYEAISGFEPMHLDEIADGSMTPDEVWRANTDWLHGMYCEVINLKIPHPEDEES